MGTQMAKKYNQRPEEMKNRIIDKLKNATSERMENLFETLYQDIMEQTFGYSTLAANLQELFKTNGISPNDPRIAQIWKTVKQMDRDGEEINQNNFQDVVSHAFTFISDLVYNRLAVSNFQDLKDDIT